MWNLFEQKLLYSPSELNTFMQSVKRLDFQSLADQIVDNMRKTVSQQLNDCHTEHILLLAPHVTQHMMQTYVTCRRWAWTPCMCLLCYLYLTWLVGRGQAHVSMPWLVEQHDLEAGSTRLYFTVF